MFLATTGDVRFWDLSQPLLMLGEWCRCYGSRGIWGRLPHRVLPYHWDDRHRILKDFHELDAIAEKLLAFLAADLNRFHGVEHDVVYWRFIIGPWLFYFVQVLYDRYASLRSAARSGSVSNTWVVDTGTIVPAMPDFAAFARSSETDDTFNHLFYSDIIAFTGDLPYQVVSHSPGPDHLTDTAGSGHRWPRRLLAAFNASICSPFNSIVLVSSCIKGIDLLRLHMALGQMPFFSQPSLRAPELPPDPLMRAKLLSGADDRTEFTALLHHMIRRHMPTVYLEGYETFRRQACRAFPRRPKVIFTAVAFYADEGFKFWAAHHRARGAILVGMQNGGHYGTGRWSAVETHQIRSFNRFYSWGWRTAEHPHVIPLPAVPLNAFKRKTRRCSEGRILLMMGAVPRYAYYMFSVSIAASGHLKYLEDQFHFVAALNGANRKRLTVRLHPIAYGWHHRERWRDRYPDIDISAKATPLMTDINRSSLYIGTYNATTFLETFTADLPTVLFWRPDQWDLRDAAVPYFDALKTVGILHDTPESAAEKVNAISSDPLEWWRRPTVQAAKNRFVQQFAAISPDWCKQLKTALKALRSTAPINPP